MRRIAFEYLKEWHKRENSKPLIIRGARQVGKSTLIKLFCKEQDLDLIEFNFELERLHSIEEDDFNIQSLLDEIQLKKKKKLSQKTIILFDEIQEQPKLLKLLRYFYERCPHLKVIAAGSLLEIAFKSENFSFPVGRVEFYHLGPMTFQEFLWATNNSLLDEKLSEFNFSPAVHSEALKALKNYFYVGGMPEAVKQFAETKSIAGIRELQSQLVQAYNADFPKYNRRIDLKRISRIFSSIGINIGEKIIFKKLDSDSTSRDIKRVVELLIDSRTVLNCVHTSANSSPLAGEANDKIFKTYFFDIGLLGAILNIDHSTLDHEFKAKFNVKGKLAEQYVAQQLNGAHEHTPPILYYYLRDKSTQKSEIDFLIEHKSNIFPIEVKSSASGHLKSLKHFCSSRQSKLGIKTSLAEFSVQDGFTSDCRLVNIPLYAINYLHSNFNKILE